MFSVFHILFFIYQYSEFLYFRIRVDHFLTTF
nr:MAG TPA: hypothetical protein [Caudoviricetes sp.]DAS26397.1 MAG TPA: hypothetical protein [Caudoviricetes sp.]DAZ54957.1 MAG TPA: hypothetical protein [Caudoviricetes sp.]